MALEPALSFEGVRHNINAVMSLPARSRAGMALVAMGFVLDLEALRRESLGQLPFDQICGAHAVRIRQAARAGQWLSLRRNRDRRDKSSLVGVIHKSA